MARANLPLFLLGNFSFPLCQMRIHLGIRFLELFITFLALLQVFLALICLQRYLQSYCFLLCTVIVMLRRRDTLPILDRFCSRVGQFLLLNDLLFIFLKSVTFSALKRTVEFPLVKITSFCILCLSRAA